MNLSHDSFLLDQQGLVALFRLRPTRRAIDIHEGEKVDASAFKALVKAAVAQNGPQAKKR
jgi:hypothetical protein